MLKRKDFPVHIEWNGTPKDMRFYVSDCLRVDHYERTLVLLYTRLGAVRIEGQRLSILLFDGGGVEIQGRIGEVSLLYAK
jgi:hypothetical protein